MYIVKVIGSSGVVKYNFLNEKSSLQFAASQMIKLDILKVEVLYKDLTIFDMDKTDEV